ncbi:podocalyxin [Lithobates pipiens]
MAILYLVLAVLSVVGSSSSQNTLATSVAAPMAPTNISNQPTNAAASVSPPVSQSGTTVASVVSTPAKVDSSVTTPQATTIAGQQGTITTPSNKAFTGASSSIASVPATSSLAGPVTVTKQTATSLAVATSSQYNASTVDNSVTTSPGLTKQPEGTNVTETSQASNATKTSLKSTPSVTVNETTMAIPVSGAPKSTTIRTPGSSSASPPPKMTSPTTAAETKLIMTTKPITAKPPSSSPSSVPTAEAELTTHEDIKHTTSQKTTENNKVKKPMKNIEVRCTNTTSLTLNVMINMKGSAFCGNDGQRTEDGQSTEDTISMAVCKALKPGYQENQGKCIIQLARINENQLVITEAFIESHLQPKELYTQLKKNGEHLNLFSYAGEDPEDEDVVSIPLISAIVSLAVLLLIIAAAYGCWHQRKARKREQRLTEELQTMENGYHDNPTLEVMETSPEMQEKKGGPNGELGDSWIVPLDNLTREDLEEEEDTHL